MDTVRESDSEERVRSGETRQEVEDEEDDGGLTKLRGASAPQKLLSLDTDKLCPASYSVNSARELRLLAIADNFQHQYSHLYPDRKPLLLCPLNECGVKKFVSTTLQPTPPVHPELFTWQGCASFVADFLSLDPLEPPVDTSLDVSKGVSMSLPLNVQTWQREAANWQPTECTEKPRFLFSSTSVLQTQRATCFEFAALLCSLLLGAHYDAYCVSGYAVEEMCLCDQSGQECPLLDEKVKSDTLELEPQENKYTVKPVRQLKSHFMMQQEKKQQDAEAASLQRQRAHEQGEQRPADPLRGLRVHCWVLVLSGSRSIQENFFIDPLTGNSYTTDDDNFLGIESIWNNLNYYVNMQDCKNGCTDMVYDLEDLRRWEPVLYGATRQKQPTLDVLKRKESKMMSRINNDEEEEEQPQVFQMPRSWVSPIAITKKDLEMRWPGGTKETRYRRAKLESFAAYLRSDGLVTRLTTYKDLDCTEVIKVKEWYEHRSDHLEEREVNKVNDVTTERFKPGRRFHLLLHRYTTQSAHTEREMEFSRARTDDLVRRVESPGEMTEIFEGRDDSLYCRCVVFDRRVQFSDADVENEPKYRGLQKVVERFHRNKSKLANEDVAERVFLLAHRRIEVTCHLEDNHFIPSRRSFVKPRESTLKTRAENFSPDMVSSFQVGSSDKPVETLALYEMLVNLMKDEEEAVRQIKVSKREVRDILSCRKQEERDVHLCFSPWTTTGLARARHQRQEMEHLAAEERRWLQEKEEDILTPFLMRLDNAETLSAQDAKQLHKDCLVDFKQRLEERVNLIQECLEKETRELQKEQQWYQKNQLNMTKQQEKEYQSYCSKKTLRIHIAKKRLSMFQEAAPQKYHVLDQRLKRDPRLSPHLLT